MTQFLSVKDWDKFQHYKDRQPPWIKLHRELLDNYEFTCLQDASKAHLMLIWLLASQLDNRVPNDAGWIARRIGALSTVNIKLLIDKGFLVVEQNDSILLAERSPEAEAQGKAEEDPPKPPMLPAWLDLDAWQRFLAHRSKIKKPLSDDGVRIAINMLAKIIEDGHNHIEAIDTSIVNNWTGIFPPKGAKNGTRNSGRYATGNGAHANLLAGFGIADLE